MGHTTLVALCHHHCLSPFVNFMIYLSPENLISVWLSPGGSKYVFVFGEMQD